MRLHRETCHKNVSGWLCRTTRNHVYHVLLLNLFFVFHSLTVYLIMHFLPTMNGQLCVCRNLEFSRPRWINVVSDQLTCSIINLYHSHFIHKGLIYFETVLLQFNIMINIFFYCYNNNISDSTKLKHQYCFSIELLSFWLYVINVSNSIITNNNCTN